MSTRLNGVICWYCNSEPAEPCEACDEVNALLGRVDEAQLRSIEARNPGIDMDEVRRIRGGYRSGGTAATDLTSPPRGPAPGGIVFGESTVSP